MISTRLAVLATAMIIGVVGISVAAAAAHVYDTILPQ